jgi:DNA (cytosine-5)-methyltransferase 1
LISKGLEPIIKPMEKTVIELFAGVGGFRVGLNNVDSIDSNGRGIEKGPFKFVWANQWEPASKNQEAFNCYAERFGKEGASNVDISLVDKKTIPNHTLLVGGFPCQDYSVAHSLSKEKGIEGKKGVLWWQIRDILHEKHPKFVLLENVDRLLKSPAKQRGRDFGIMLRCFADEGYAVQWRVINAADYGHPQRRRRTFIFACYEKTKYYKNFEKVIAKKKPDEILSNEMIFAAGFPCVLKDAVSGGSVETKKYETLVDVSDKFAFGFEGTGFMLDGQFFTADTKPISNTNKMTLGDVLDSSHVADYCYKVNVDKFKYLKGAKHILRTAKNGHQYFYSEGPIPFPDKLDEPSRTMLTSEGTTNRSTHFILDPLTNKYRILTPVECERLDEFPDNWTNTGMTAKWRYFIAGNALVCGIIKTLGDSLNQIIASEN